MKKAKQTLLIIAIGLLLTSCAPVINIPTLNPGNKADAGDVVQANNLFALDLYNHYKTKEGNIFFSPYSISTALAMTYEGAKGKTASEIQDVFHFPKDGEKMRSGYANVISELNKKDKPYELQTANALWAHNGFTFLDDYFDLIGKYYGGKVTNLDFVKDTENSRKTINTWVEQQTKNKIKDLIPAGMLDPTTRLVLTNAIYFKGDWIKQFEKNNTRPQDFRITPENQVEVQMMNRTDKEAKFNYAENDILQILEMPYKGDELSMLVLLPKNDDLEKLENSLSLKNIESWKKGLENQRVKVYFPKFKFETKYFMKDDLTSMGMPTAFTWPDADFTGMTGDIPQEDRLYIGFVIHQAYVEVDEKGTEAAAATAVGMLTGAAPGFVEQIPVFLADHPFIFIIQHKETGNILFMGRVSDPR